MLEAKEGELELPAGPCLGSTGSCLPLRLRRRH